MAQYTAHWGNRLEDLADRMFAGLFGTPADDPLTPCCIVTNSGILQAWLRHYFVFDWPGRHTRILANCDFQQLYPFVNDWMDTLLQPPEPGRKRWKRDARHHPYSTGCLQWRLFRMLDPERIRGDGFGPVRAWLGANPPPRRRFQLAGRLATLYDDYQVFRCRVLKTWEDGADPDDWQAILWRQLIRDDARSYAGLFRVMDSTAPADITARFDAAYRQVAVFGTTAMPIPYLGFLQDILARVVDVDLYVLNPSDTYWLEDVTPARAEKRHEQLLLEDHPLKEDPLMLPEKGHPLLCSLGQSLQEHLHAVHELAEGGISDEFFRPSVAATLLADLQNRMLAREEPPPAPRAVDDSIQVHICHSARREVEVLHDHLLHGFTEEKLQPYQVLVLVTDMDTYAPVIDAVFGSVAPDAPDAIPYAIEGRPAPAESLLQDAFRAVLHIATSRFTASDIVDLLNNDPMLTAAGLQEGDRGSIADFISKAGIRWGINAEHRQDLVGTAMEPYTSWEYGLERLLAGYALGSEAPTGTLWPVDTAEDASAEALGRLVRFLHRLKGFRERLTAPRTPAAWQKSLLDLADTFFASTNETYHEVTAIRQAIAEIRPLTDAAGLHSHALPFDVVAAFLESAMESAPKRSALLRNAVIFGQLRPMNSRPAEVICLLGMVDGVFPRSDNRPTFDLLRQTRHRGDRSIRRDDRCAFLEALVNARRRLFISYPGRSDRSRNVIPPSIVLQELRDCLCRTYALEEDGDKRLPLETLHRMQGVNPAYFRGDGNLFSYSREHLQAARRIAARNAAAEPPPPGAATGSAAPASGLAPLPQETGPATELDSLIRFFRNPAQYYYRDIMELALDIRDDGVPGDAEPMVMETLNRYALNEALLTRLRDNGYDLGGVHPEQFTAQGKANAQAPLGAAGDAAIQELLENTGAWLTSPPPDLPWCSLTVLELLKAQDAAAETRAVLACPPTPAAGGDTTGPTLAGELKRMEHAGRRVRIFARPSGLKTKDRIRGWITHLFACAAGESGVHTLLIGKSQARTEREYYQPIAADEAMAHLQTLVRLYRDGQRRPIPLAPETAYACVKARQEDPGNLRKGMEAAAKAWTGNPYARGDSEDRWMFHAFGEDGPMDRPAFMETADAVFQPLLAHLSTGDGDPAPARNGETA